METIIKQRLTIFFCCFLITTCFSQKRSKVPEKKIQELLNSDKFANRAKKGDKVHLVLIHVKADSKKKFERWIKNVFYTALYKTSNKENKAQVKVTRFLTPREINFDGTYTFCWIMDPLIPNLNYDIKSFLVQEYGEKLAQNHMIELKSCLARDIQDINLIQTEY